MSQTTIVYPLPTGLAGQLADTLDNDVLPAVNAESVNLMPFGIMLAKGTLDYDALLPANNSITPIGVLVLSFTYDDGPNGELVNTSNNVGGGLKPQANLNILRVGRIYVVVEEAVNAYDRAYIRTAPNGPNTQLGAFRKSADSGNAMDVTKKCQYLTSASAGGIALLDVDMRIS